MLLTPHLSGVPVIHSFHDYLRTDRISAELLLPFLHFPSSSPHQKTSTFSVPTSSLTIHLSAERLCQDHQWAAPCHIPRTHLLLMLWTLYKLVSPVILASPHLVPISLCSFSDALHSASVLGPCLLQLRTPHWLLIVFTGGFQPLNSVLSIGCRVELLEKLWKILMPESSQAHPSPRDPGLWPGQWDSNMQLRLKTVALGTSLGLGAD